MAEEVNNLILTHLRAIREGQDDIKRRLSSLEDQVAGLTRQNAELTHQIAGLRSDLNHHVHRTDSLEARVECIERRLGLSEPE